MDGWKKVYVKTKNIAPNQMLICSCIDSESAVFISCTWESTSQFQTAVLRRDSHTGNSKALLWVWAAFCSILHQNDSTLLQKCWGMGSGGVHPSWRYASTYISVQFLCHIAYYSLLFFPYEWLLDSLPSMETISDDASANRKWINWWARGISHILCQVFFPPYLKDIPFRYCSSDVDSL